MFELIYKEELYASSSHPQIFGGSIQYSQFKEIYDGINDLDTNQFILTYGKDPFGISVLLDDIKEHTGVDFAKEIVDYMNKSKL